MGQSGPIEPDQQGRTGRKKNVGGETPPQREVIRLDRLLKCERKNRDGMAKPCMEE